MKFSLDKTYVKYSIYVILTATVLYILYGFISNIHLVFSWAGGLIQNILSLLSPLIIGLVIAYLLNPIANWIEGLLSNSRSIISTKKTKVPIPVKEEKVKKDVQNRRAFSVLLTYVIVFSALGLFIYGGYSMIGGQLTNNKNLTSMVESMGKYIDKYNLTFDQLQIKLQESGLSTDFKEQILQVADSFNRGVGGALGGVLNHIRKTGGNIINVVLGLIIAFYLLKDKEYFASAYSEVMELLISRKYNQGFHHFMRDIDRVISQFIRGQLLDGLIVGIITAIVLSIIGLEFAVVIGMIAGIANVIPYFGPIIGMIPAVIVGLLSDSPIKALFAVIAMLVIQQIDGAVISPKVVGDSVGLHPVFVIISIIIGGSYFGLLGMVIAVPAAAVIKLLLGRLLETRKQIKASAFQKESI